jgi:hypothetical protein
VHQLLQGDEDRHVLTDLYATEFCVWLQAAPAALDAAVAALAVRLASLAPLDPALTGWPLHALEAETAEGEGGEEEDAGSDTTDDDDDSSEDTEDSDDATSSEDSDDDDDDDDDDDEPAVARRPLIEVVGSWPADDNNGADAKDDGGPGTDPQA